MNPSSSTLDPGPGVRAYVDRLTQALPRVRERMARAEATAGRAEGSVGLVAVTKGHPIDAVRAAVSLGLGDLGENRVAELEEKAAAVGPEPIRWHMIGNLQRRKVPRALDLAALIHSVDSLRLAERVSHAAVEAGRVADVLIQVNTSGEAAKSGLAADGAVEGVHVASELPGLRVRGLMTMAPLDADTTTLHAAFRGLREISERARAVGASVGEELSMGMTNDLEPAVEEGSTMVRIGTALFGERTR